jgi:hypothetical protein
MSKLKKGQSILNFPDIKNIIDQYRGIHTNIQNNIIHFFNMNFNGREQLDKISFQIFIDNYFTPMINKGQDNPLTPQIIKNTLRTFRDEYLKGILIYNKTNENDKDLSDILNKEIKNINIFIDNYKWADLLNKINQLDDLTNLSENEFKPFVPHFWNKMKKYNFEFTKKAAKQLVNGYQEIFIDKEQEIEEEKTEETIQEDTIQEETTQEETTQEEQKTEEQIIPPETQVMNDDEISGGGLTLEDKHFRKRFRKKYKVKW